MEEQEKSEQEVKENSTQANEEFKKKEAEIQEKLQQGTGFEFTAEIQKLLDILVNSLYSHKEIFLRELISNAADALDKVRFKMLTENNLRNQELPLEIHIQVNKEQNMLILSDTGIGMSKEELIENIGTIAHSGSMSFLKQLSEQKEKKADVNLIGKFGVGFYSVFMVARQVDIVTLSAYPDKEAYLWSSQGDGKYKLAPINKETRGTEIRIHLKEEEKQFLEEERIKSVVQRYSDFISYPIQLEGKQINKLSAIWQRSASEVKEEEYKEFYSYLTHNQEAPLSTIHLSYDAPIQFNSILFIPASVPWDMTFDIPEKWHGVHLYAKKVFIQSDCEELLPMYLRFVRGVVDSDDLPLNISRETLQENQVITKIRKNLVRRVLERMEQMSAEKKDDYKKLWLSFSKFIKQGYRGDYENREKLAKLFRFYSSKEAPENLISLQEYVDRMKEGQKDIYYISGENRESIEKSPHLEIFKRKDIEVLYMVEPIDDFLLSDMTKFQDKNIVSVDREDLSLDDVKEAEEKKDATETKESPEISERSFEDFLHYVKDILKEKIVDVRFSKRLTGSPCCLVAAKDAPSVGMQKIMKMWMNEKYEMPKRILEINKEHFFIKNLIQIYNTDPRNAILPLSCEQLIDNALILEGSPLDARAMVPRIQEMMEKMADLLSKKA
ncbi:MAG: molecular chaperone HtpG [Candidatus Brocadiae bacterium]|nr:molecular chaperone HtpG [Candidatus Brocadiia bacterium]